MENYITSALTEALPLLEKRTPLTKKDTIYVNIEDVNPLEISTFMKDNNIPNDAYFGGKPNGYDAIDYPCLCYEVDIPTSKKERLEYNRRVFGDIVFRILYNTLTTKGYKRIVFDSVLGKNFKDTTVYDMFINNQIDRLVKYYSLYFVKI